jgi:divalent metal cation (Fe/Co/Zn/Cd) transporter
MPDDQIGPNLQSGLRISQLSLSWTVAAGSAAIVIGIAGNSLALITFGLIGVLDAIGSASLIVHFRHSRRHEAISERHERMALVIVTTGMAIIGIATIADSAYRLETHATSSSLILGTVLAAVSAFVLTFLALTKRKFAHKIPSHALLSDGWVSGVGAGLALVVLAGTALDAGLGLWWIDPVAAIVIAGCAIALSVRLAQTSP